MHVVVDSETHQKLKAYLELTGVPITTVASQALADWMETIGAARLDAMIGLFIAAGSFFLGPSNRPLRLFSAVRLGQLLPAVLFSSGVYLALTLPPLILLVFWLMRVHFTKIFGATSKAHL